MLKAALPQPAAYHACSVAIPSSLAFVSQRKQASHAAQRCTGLAIGAALDRITYKRTATSTDKSVCMQSIALKP